MLEQASAGRTTGRLMPHHDVGGEQGAAQRDVIHRGQARSAATGHQYAGGPGLSITTLVSITTLADILARAGAVRAMELDINTGWVNFAAYDPHGSHARAAPANGKDLLTGMLGAPDRYSQAWWPRDFFTMSARPVPRSRAAR